MWPPVGAQVSEVSKAWPLIQWVVQALSTLSGFYLKGDKDIIISLPKQKSLSFHMQPPTLA